MQGLLLLAVGRTAMDYVNHEALLRQADEVAENKYSKRAERGLTHPLPLNRLQRIAATTQAQ